MPNAPVTGGGFLPSGGLASYTKPYLLFMIPLAYKNFTISSKSTASIAAVFSQPICSCATDPNHTSPLFV
jgi:hypothetical protein